MTKPITNTLTNLGKGERYLRYTCGSGVGITRSASALDYPQAVSRLAESLSWLLTKWPLGCSHRRQFILKPNGESEASESQAIACDTDHLVDIVVVERLVW